MSKTKKSVLIVDDVQANLDSMEKLLQAMGLEVTKAKSGPEALRILFDKKYSLILLDVQMPEMSGFEIAEEIRKDSKNDATPLIFISAYEQDKDKTISAYKNGISDFIAKPVDPEILRCKLNNYLELNSLREKTYSASLEKPSVFIVDDNNANLKSFEQILKNEDLDIWTCDSGNEALKTLKNNVFSLILLDIQMPEMSGFELAVKIRQLKQHHLTPIVFISAYEQDQKYILDSFKEHSVLDFIPKPVDPDILRAKVNNYIEVYRLRQRNHIYDSLVKLNTDGYWEWEINSSRNSFFMSDNFKSQLGYPYSKIENSLETWYSLFENKEDRLNFDKLISKITQEANDDADSIELKFLDSDNNRVWMIAKIKLVKNELGEAFRIVGFMTNITKEKLISEALRLSNDELEDFAHLSSHDLREPLRSIRQYIWLLQEKHNEEFSSKAGERLLRIKDLADHMDELIESLLNFSRLGKGELAISEVELGSLLSKIIHSLKETIDECNAQIVIKQLPSIKCDSVRIGEVFRNLICNALKYNDKDQPIIEIGSCKKADLTDIDILKLNLSNEVDIIYVKDNGIGIEEKHFMNIFKIFKSLHSGKSEYGGGTGFGLSFVKKAINRHNGVIWLSSALGDGTCFYFTLNQ